MQITLSHPGNFCGIINIFSYFNYLYACFLLYERFMQATKTDCIVIVWNCAVGNVLFKNGVRNVLLKNTQENSL